LRFKGGNLAALMVRAGWVLGLVVCLGAGVALADLRSPLIDGEYVAGQMGVLRLDSTPVNGSKERFRVKGEYVSGTRCAFVSPEVLLEGVIDGTVLVATLKTCMEGSGCPTTNGIALLGVIGEGTVTAYIDLPTGCSAPGFDSQKLTLQATPNALKETAKAYLGAKNYVRAAAVYRRLAELSQSETELLVVYLQLGSAYNGIAVDTNEPQERSKRYAEARGAFRKAMALSAFGDQAPAYRVSVLVNLACAEAGLVGAEPDVETAAIGHLKEALDVARKDPELLAEVRAQLATDKELDALRNKPDFQKLIGKKGPR
jgi:hypothetical protein